VRRRRLPTRAARTASIASLLFIGSISTLVYGDTIPLDTLNLVGTSQLISGNVIRLTPNTDPDPNGPPPAGGAWTTGTFNVAAPFTLNFDFRMGDWAGRSDNDCSGGDGIAFLI
jgi:hypothetical protein